MGGGYEDKCGVVEWNDIDTTRIKLKNRWFLSRPYPHSRLVTNNMTFTSFTAEENWTFEFLHFISIPHWSYLWRNADYSDSSLGPSINIGTSGGNICEYATNNYNGLGYRSAFVEFDDPYDNIKFLNHYAIVKKDGFVYYYFNGKLKDSFESNRANHAYGTEVGYGQCSDYHGLNDGLLSMHISNVARYSDEFDYHPLDLNDPINNDMLKVY